MAIDGIASVDSFNEWSGSSENVEKFYNEEQVDDFTIWDGYDKALAENPEKIGELYGQAIEGFSQEVINKYDTDKDGEMNFSEFVSMNKEAYKNMFGEDLDTSVPGMEEGLKQAFEEISSLDSNTNTIIAKEYGATLAVADGQDENMIDGNITYENFHFTPELKGYTEALAAYYAGIFQ